jgi:hypothetical protein
MKTRQSTTPRSRTLIVAALVGAGASMPLGAEAPDVHARLVVATSIAPGTKGTIVVLLDVGSAWHVNSHTPSDAFLIPTDIDLAASIGTLSPVRYPQDVERRFPFSEKPLKVYEGAVAFEIELELPSTATAEVSLSGTLSYQACNDRQCFPPAALPLAAVIRVESPR